VNYEARHVVYIFLHGVAYICLRTSSSCTALFVGVVTFCFILQDGVSQSLPCPPELSVIAHATLCLL